MTAFVIANTAFNIIYSAFTRNLGSLHQCFRLKNLQDDEICELVRLWDLHVPGSPMKDVRLVVARDEALESRMPSSHIAAPGHSITYYRNHNDAGLVYLESKVQSDEQGLQNIFTLRDSNFLDGSFDEYAGAEGGVAELMLVSAWRELNANNIKVPSLLRERALEVINLLHPGIEPVPVRRYAAFVSEVCRRWIDTDAPKDDISADGIVGKSLSQLEMFPDFSWRQGITEARVKRRLELNLRHAELSSGGSEIDPEDIIRLADNAQFSDENGNKLDPQLRARYADLCKKYAVAPTYLLRNAIPYTIFEQLFQKDSAGLKLGDRVRVEIEGADPSRLTEFDQCDLIQGLNSKLQADAERLVSLTPPEGLKPLIELLSNRTRKTVERVAAPPATRFVNPIIELVRVTRELQVLGDGLRLGKIHIACADNDARMSATRGLFSFVYGPTLQALIDETRDVPGACELSVESCLIEQCAVPGLVEETEGEHDNEQGAAPVSWPPLVLSISVLDENGKLIESHDKVEWAPDNIYYLALFWLLVAAEDAPGWESIGGLKLHDSEDWLNALVHRDKSLQVIEPSSSSLVHGLDQIADDLISQRQELRNILRSSGLSIEALNDFTDAWQRLIEVVRTDYIPDGTRPRVLEAVLDTDMLSFDGEDRRLMLPTQPMRMRWLASYLQRCFKLAASCMTGITSFSVADGYQYLEWLESLSPHECPPTAMGKSGEILHARTEVAWFEEFAPLLKISADVSVDLYALKSISARILDYLEAHPFKCDGLSLLLLLPSSDAVPAQLIELVTKSYPDLRLSLTVAAPKARWEKIARLVESLPNEERKSGSGRLFPARDLAFIEFDVGVELGSALDGQSFDISIVTHVLQESVVSQQNTEPPVNGRVGAFDPVLDRPIRLESAGSGGAISIVMRPRAPDLALETWGTLVVRANRSCPVSPSQPENIDFVELRVNFQDSARVFRSLHERSHWVITLERHISREQIESVEAGAPDVLSVETGIGSNGLSTLIVSSHSGRELIEARLVRKLKKLIPGGVTGADENTFLIELAKRVYEETRKLSPHLALQAMGVARVTEEILGLCIARRFADEVFPADVSDGLLAWISLDEQTAWFGGAANIRADMCRVIIQRNPDGFLDLDVLVLEGKFRQNYDSHGVVQVSKTIDFLENILSTTVGGDTEHVDADMWRERFLSAIENVASDALKVVHDGDSSVHEECRSIPADIRQLFRGGKYRIRSVSGLYSICLWENFQSEVDRDVKGSISVVRSSRVHIIDLIGRPNLSVDVRAFEKAQNAIAAIEGFSDLPAIASDNGLVDMPEVTNQIIERNEPFAAEDMKLHNEDSPQVKGVKRIKSGVSQAELAAMYDEVLSCFASHNVAVLAAEQSDSPIIEGPASILFKVRVASGVDPRKVFEKSQALKLKLELEQDQSITFDIDRGYVTIDVPKKPEHRYYVSAEDLWINWSRPDAELAVPLGEDRYGELVAVNFSSSNSPHLLVAGTTGSGKSEALNTMLYGLVRFYGPSELKLMLVDPKGTELTPFERAAHLIGTIGWDDADALVMLKEAVEEMQQRYIKFKQKGCRSLVEFNSKCGSDERLPWWLVVLDEYADLTHDPQSKKEIEQELKRLAQKARAAGIHVIIATQKPSADVISTNLRSNLPSQLALRVKSGIESRVVLDEAGAENLNGRGDALLKADGKVRRVQCAKVATGLELL
ncbi:FtsK/SpoIIIE domain-containing protein [Pseudomonas putida]|uniref:FtsK/SpoIIIE domain-containing protein n=1 Tax=Pseudomonas putida TaxID=303 RepID=UPI002164B27E|nr:FtsK/SpoIIIE domain-containing protein [Pseudomonas putida]